MSREVIPPSVEDLKKVGVEIPKEGVVILDIFTEWCGPCKQISPVLHALQDEGLIKVVQEDLDKNRPLAENHNIMAIPTLVIFKDGKRIGDIPGDASNMPLTEFFQRATQGLDVSLLKDGKEIEIKGFEISIKRSLVKDGVMVGFPGEEALRKLVKEL